MTAIAPSVLAATGRGFWQLKVFDRSGNLVDLPKGDVQTIDVTDSINGGSVDGTITFRRDFDNIGALGFLSTLQLWIWGPNQPRPVDPWWSGWLQNFDQVQLTTSGHVVAHVVGDMRLLDAAVVTESVNPGTNGNPQIDAAVYLKHLITTYQPATWLAPIIPSAMFAMFPVQFNATKLSSAIDTVCKQSLDSSGRLFTWYVRTNAALQRRVVVQVDQNPNTVPTASFTHLFTGAEFDQYKIVNKNDQITNLVSIIGAQDPATGQTAFGSFEDTVSIAQNGAWEDVLSIPFLANNAACASYAKTYLAQKAYTQAQGTFRVLIPNANLLGGRWVQLWEAPGTGTTAPQIKQVRLSNVKVAIDGSRILMAPNTVSPIPFLDEATYKLGQHVNLRTAISTLPRPVDTQTLYVRSGGYLLAFTSSPAAVALAPVDAIFPSGEVHVPGFNGIVADSSTGAGGDGHFIFSVTSSGTWSVSKTAYVANSVTSQNILEVTVIQGTPFVNDLRTLNVTTDAVNQTIMAGPGVDGSPIAKNIVTTRALASNPYPGTPPQLPSGLFSAQILTGANAAVVAYQLDGYVGLPVGFGAWLAAIEFGAVPVGSAAAGAAHVVDVAIPIDPSWTSSTPVHCRPLESVGAGTTWDIYAWLRDQANGTSTPVKIYTTPTNNSQQLGPVAMSPALLAHGPTLTYIGNLPADNVGQPTFTALATVDTFENSVSNPEIVALELTAIGAVDGQVNVVNQLSPSPTGVYNPLAWPLPAGQGYSYGIRYLDGLGGRSAIATVGTIGPQGILGGAIVTGTITDTQIAPGGISTPSISAGAITADKMGANSVVAGTIAANVITANEINVAAPPIIADEFIVPNGNAGDLIGTWVNAYQFYLLVPADTYRLAIDWFFHGDNCSALVNLGGWENRRYGFANAGGAEAVAHSNGTVFGNAGLILVSLQINGKLKADPGGGGWGVCRILLTQGAKISVLIANGGNWLLPPPGFLPPQP